MSIEERDIEEQFFKSIQFNYGKPTTKETIMNFADLIRTYQRNKDAEILPDLPDIKLCPNSIEWFDFKIVWEIARKVFIKAIEENSNPKKKSGGCYPDV